MPPSATTTFVYRIESDKPLLAAVARMYAESRAGGRAGTWREQVRHLVEEYGKDLVIEALTEDVPGLSLRHAVTLTDLAERQESGRMRAV